MTTTAAQTAPRAPRTAPERTIELPKLRTGALYLHGEVIALHQVLAYDFVEFRPWALRGGVPDPSVVQGNGLAFRAYCEGEEIPVSFDSLEEAMVGAVAYRLDGPESQASRYFFRMVRTD